MKVSSLDVTLLVNGFYVTLTAVALRDSDRRGIT
jgi:hypothetical protein